MGSQSRGPERGISPGRLHLSSYIFLFLILEGVTVADASGFSGIPGEYCATRTPSCCTARNDKCAVSLLGTECYCDDFCDRREGEQIPDCCPDFYKHCRGESADTATTEAWTQPPTRTPVKIPVIEKGCWLDGIFHPLGTRIRQNCNECTCREIGNDDLDSSLFEFFCDSALCLIQHDLIQHINTNSNFYHWRAGSYPFFQELTLDEGYHYRLGTFKPEGSVARMHEIRMDKNAILPDRFDARERWPGLINPVGDQGNCAASWAFSTAEVASDRIAIMTQGEMSNALSPQHLLSCNRNRQKGCQGGHLDRAWWFLHRKTGIVSEDCYPYVGQDAAEEKCRISLRNSTEVTGCPSGSDQVRLWQMTPPYRIANKESEIKFEIWSNGPVQAVFRVSPEFFSYKSGVYQSLEEDSIKNNYLPNYHSVRIIGWGSDLSFEPPVPYWLCTNSWGTAWGEGGTFRILRGRNEAEIESFVIGVWGKKGSSQSIQSVDQLSVRRKRRNPSQRQNNAIKRKVDAAVRFVEQFLQ